MNIGAKSEPIIEDWWQDIIDKVTDQKHIFQKALSLNLSSLSFENKGLKWQFLDWKLIILMVFFRNVRILFMAFEFSCQTSQTGKDIAPVSSKEFLDIQATIKCGFTLKRLHDMITT